MEISNSIEYEQGVQTFNYANIRPIRDTIQDVDLDIKRNTKMDEKEEIDITEIEHLINQSNKQMLVYDRRLDISIHEKTKQIMVKVIDAGTDEVIREIPPEKVLDIKAKLAELRGIMLDKKV